MSLGIAATDSAKLRIKLDKVQDLSPTITQEWVLVNSSTGEVSPHFKSKAYLHEHNGISTRFLVEKQINSKQVLVDYLTIGINSKQLEERYLEGISYNTTGKLYNYLMSLGLCKFSYQDFLEAELTDIDFKKDMILEEFDKIIELMRAHAKPRTTGRGLTVFKSKTERAIQFSERKSTSYKTAPYVKLYDKLKDLVHRSNTFAEAYDIKVQPNTIRIEGTIKNKKHLRSLGIKGNTLRDICELSQEKLQEFLTSCLKAHLDPHMARPTKTRTELSPADMKEVETIEYILRYTERSFKSYLNYITHNMNPSARYRVKKKLTELYNAHLADTDQAKKTEALDKELEQIGWNF